MQLISHLTLLSPLTFTMHSTRQYQLEFSLTKSVGLIHVTCMYTRTCTCACTCSIVYMYMYVHDRSATTTALRTAYDGIEFTQWKDAIRQISHLITYSTCTCHVHTCVMCHVHTCVMCHVHTCERSVLWLAVGAVVAVYVSCLVLLHTNTAADRGGGGGRGWMGMGKE